MRLFGANILSQGNYSQLQCGCRNYMVLFLGGGKTYLCSGEKVIMDGKPSRSRVDIVILQEQASENVRDVLGVVVMWT